MSNNAIIYEVRTGRPVSLISGADNETLARNTQAGQAWIRAYRTSLDGFYIWNNQIHDISPAPGPSWVWSWDHRQWVRDAEKAAVQIRQRRDQLLLSSDWTQGRDVPASIHEPWARYRDQLRRLPQQPGFPDSVTWPVEP